MQGLPTSANALKTARCGGNFQPRPSNFNPVATWMENPSTTLHFHQFRNCCHRISSWALVCWMATRRWARAVRAKRAKRRPTLWS